MSADLADLDDAFAAAGRPVPAAELPQAWLPNGLFTLVFPCGTHKTLRVHTQREGPLAGRRIVSLLVGPQNTDDYERVAELIPLPPGFFVWKRFQTTRTADYVELLFLLARGEKIEGHELMVSIRCLKCNRVLSDPASIAANLGPECRRTG